MGVGTHPLNKGLVLNQPPVAGVQISLINRPVRKMGYSFRVIIKGPPKVSHKLIFVVNGFDAIPSISPSGFKTIPAGPAEERSIGAKERINKIGRIAQP
jgi:hypothetical protein